MRFSLLQDYYESAEYLAKLRMRAENLQKLNDNPLSRAQMILNIYASDPIRFIEDFLYIKIPEYNNAIKPFFLFEYQKKIIWKIQELELSNQDAELLIDKPRGMGLTWLLLAYEYWKWLFSANWSGFNLSRTETEVDDGTGSPDNSLFGKIRFMIDHTPDWLIPEGYQPKGRKGTSTDSSLRILNPVMGTALMGSSTNANAGRSRRYSFVFVDECFSIEGFNNVWLSLQSVARIKIFVSTVKPGRNYKDFKELCEKSSNYISLKWSDHPFKDKIWYDDQVKKSEFDSEVMREIEPGYNINPKSQYYPEISQAKVTEVNYDRKLPLYCFVDFGKADMTIIGWLQFDGRFIYVLDCYRNFNKTLEWYVPFLNPEYKPNPEHYNPKQLELFDKLSTWSKPRGYFGEQAHFIKVMPHNTSIAQELSKKGIRLIYNQYAIAYEPRRHATASLLPRTVFNRSSDGAMELYDALANSRYASVIAPTSKNSAMKPVHDDIIADYRAAFENACTNIGRIVRSQRDDIQPDFKDNNFAANLIKYLRI